MRRVSENRDEVALRRAEQDAEFYGANLKVYMENQSPPEVVSQYRRWTADALITLGRFEEAIETIGDDPALRDLVDEMAEVIRAVYKPDDARCDCVHEIEGVRYPNYIRDRRIRINGEIRRVWKCGLCGHMNAIVGPVDELHQLARSQEESVRRAVRTNENHKPIPDQQVLRNATP